MGGIVFRRIDDFAEELQGERSSTIRLFENLTDESLATKATPDGRSLGFLAWHITGTYREMMSHAGLDPEGPDVGDPVPQSAAEILRAYQRASASVLEQATTRWSDDMVEDEIPAYGQTFKRGQMMDMLIRHEAHHRGQMTMLMRMAGLPVAGPYGPSREGWAAMGLEAAP
jgi:uncharacterized damage-inducible protein DinB